MQATAATPGCSSHFNAQLGSVLDEPVANFHHFNLRHRQPKATTQARSEHFVGQDADVLGIVLGLYDPVTTIGSSEQMRLCSAAHLANVLHGIKAIHGNSPGGSQLNEEGNSGIERRAGA